MSGSAIATGARAATCAFRATRDTQLITACPGRCRASVQRALRAGAKRALAVRVEASAAPVAAVTAASAGGAAALGLPVAQLFTAASGAMIPVYMLLAFFPKMKLTRALLIESSLPYTLLAALYATTLGFAWAAGLGGSLWEVAAAAKEAVVALDPGALDLAPVGRLFTSHLVTLLAWLHLLALDALLAREVVLDGLRNGVPTVHSVLLCFFFGPTGLLSHAATRLVFARR